MATPAPEVKLNAYAPAVPSANAPLSVNRSADAPRSNASAPPPFHVSDAPVSVPVAVPAGEITPPLLSVMALLLVPVPARVPPLLTASEPPDARLPVRLSVPALSVAEPVKVLVAESVRAPAP